MEDGGNEFVVAIIEARPITSENDSAVLMSREVDGYRSSGSGSKHIYLSTVL